MSPLAIDAAVAPLMSRRPIVIGPEEPLAAAAALLTSCRIRHLPVMVSGSLVGILSLRDVLAADEEARVGEAMTPGPQTIAPTLPITAAAQLMLQHRFSCLPVVENGALLGLFTVTDALRFALGQLTDEAQRSGHRPTVSQLMTARPIIVAAPQTPLVAAWRMMKRAGVRHLPVIEDDEVIGMLSDRDVLATGRVWLDGTPGADALVVADAMSRRLVRIDAGRPALEAAHLLLRRRLGALPVLEPHGPLQGILSVVDFLQWLVGRT